MRLFDTSIYTARRAALRTAVGSGTILLMGNEEAPMNYKHNIYRFRQDSSFLYFFGLNMPGLYATIDCDTGREVLYGHEYTMDDIIWVGPQAHTLSDYAAMVGVDVVKSPTDTHWATSETIHYLPPYRHLNTMKIASWTGQSIAAVEQGSSAQLVDAVIEQRSVKSAEEIAEMTKAVNVSRAMHIAAMQAVRHGKMEYDIVGEIYRTAKSQNCYLAYPAIFSKDGQTLHNHHHHNRLQKGDLVLNDSGAENDMCYAGDITRTVPVGGTFSNKQKEIYNIVLDMEVSSIEALQPGLPYRDVHISSNEIMLTGLKELGLLKGDVEAMIADGVGGLFMPHGLGHMIGLDVHDMEDLGEDKVGYGTAYQRSTQLGLKSLRLARELQEDFVITVEPGIYFIPQLIEKWRSEGLHSNYINYDRLKDYYDFGGIRIEDDVLITKTGSRILGAPIPKTVQEVEDVMKD